MKFNYSAFIFGSIFTFVGGFLFYKSSYDIVINSYESYKWPQTTATVVTSEVNNRSGEDDTMYDLVFSAEYEINNKQYYSNAPFLTKGGRTSWAGNRYEFANSHPVGSTVKLYFHPEKPWISTLEPGFKSIYFEMILFSGLFFCLGLLTVIISIVRYFRSRVKSSSSKSFSDEFV